MTPKGAYQWLSFTNKNTGWIILSYCQGADHQGKKSFGQLLAKMPLLGGGKSTLGPFPIVGRQRASGQVWEWKGAQTLLTQGWSGCQSSPI